MLREKKDVHTHLVKSTVEEFVNNASSLHSEMLENFSKAFNRNPSSSEVRSWKNSLPKLAEAIDCAQLKNCLIYL